MKTYVVGTQRGYCSGTSNEYPQHMFLLRNKKNIDTFLVEKCALARAMYFHGEIIKYQYVLIEINILSRAM